MRGQLYKTCAGSFDLASTLIVGEPEDLVFPERPAHCIAELIAPKFRFGGIKESPGVEFVVAQKLEDGAVDSIGTRLGNRIHDRAAEFSVLRVKAVGDETKLFHRIKIGD